MKDATEFNIEGILANSYHLPDGFRDKCSLIYKMDVVSLFEWFSGVLTKTGMSRITGLNKSLVSQYASGIRTPSSKQIRKIEEALHNLGK
jgi:queuine/archaeosine tRNA-ribosyltransferase